MSPIDAPMQRRHVKASAPGLSAPSSADPRLADAVERYRAALRAGRRPDPREFCAEYPDLAGPLAECLDALDFLHAAGRDLAGPAPGPARPVEVKPGDRLGDFRILNEVGRGGMAIVYAAEQVSLARRVALKVLPGAALTEPRRLQRFQNEARAAGCLHHPNIVPVHAVGCEGGVHFYAMQLISGQSIASLIRNLSRQAHRERPSGEVWLSDIDSGAEPTVQVREGEEPSPHSAHATSAPKSLRIRSLSETSWVRQPAFLHTVAQFGWQAAQALEHAHQNGIIHRDIKPGNLLVDSTGNLWVTDFGLSHLHGDATLTATGDLVGTFLYMSPEQAQGRRAEIDHRTDVYSLGATLYELLTLSPPMDGEEPHELLRRVADEEPRALHRINPAIPADLEVIVLKAMAKEPADRYASAQDLADDLRRFLDDRPILARRPSYWQRARRWARRHRPLVFSSAIAAAVLIVSGVVGLGLYSHELKSFGVEQQKLGKQARADLYRALVSDSHALRLAHRPGYRAAVRRNLIKAASLDVEEPDSREKIAAAAIACLGDPIGLDPVDAPTVERLKPLPVPAGFANVLKSTFADTKPFGLTLRPDSISRTAVARDGKLVVAVSGDKLLLFSKPGDYPVPEALWNAAWRQPAGASHVLIGALESPFGAVYDLAFDQDGTRLIAGCEGGFRVWEIPPPGKNTVPGGSVRCTVGSGNTYSVAMHPQGWLAAVAGRHIELWSCPLGRPIATLSVPELATRVEFSADGQWLLALRGDRIVRGWPVGDTPEKRRLHGHEGAGVPCVAYSPDGKTLASVSKDKTIKLWETSTGRLLRTIVGHPSAIEAVAFSPDGQLLATGDVGGTVFLWDAATGAQRTHLFGANDPPGQVWRLQFDISGRHLAAAGVRGVAVWDIQRLPVEVKVCLRSAVRTADVYDFAFHPGNESFAYVVNPRGGGDGQLYCCDLHHCDRPRRLAVSVRRQVRSLHFDHTGGALTFVTPAGKLGRWDWNANAAMAGPDLPAFQWAPAPGGRWAATSTADRAVTIFDLDAGMRMLTLPSEEGDVWTLAWSPDHRRLAIGTSDGVVALWDLDGVRVALVDLGAASPELP